MQIVCSDAQQQHDPPPMSFRWQTDPYLESPARVEQILSSLKRAGIGPLVPPRDFGLAPILAVHDAEYLDFLGTIYRRWVAEGGPPEGVVPDSMPVRVQTGKPTGAFGQAGYYISDITCPILPRTYEAALASAQIALTATTLVMEGATVAYALCRPPGHHTHRDMTGGYCYLNNAAIAARALCGTGRVAVLDIDYHAGNGTESIFYATDEVLFVSIHADPNKEYPYFLGYAEERGEGQGMGYTLNLPLPFGTGDDDYLIVLEQALKAIRQADVTRLVVSAGFDTFKDDPIGHFKLTTQIYTEIGRRILALNLPTVIIQEGGYAIESLGHNVVSFLRGFETN